ncbi:MAG: drug/metabolite exporter YedA [Phycisphaerae bacterium]|nr:drug/metabolite exporter YedA [Gemmatimonadaceae bacterium]
MKATRLQLLLGFLVIYVVWGSTYLGIRVGIATIPPFLMAGTRFLIAGGILYAWSRLRGGAKPDLEQWKNAGIIGALLLMVGNGAVSWAEQRVDSGMTSLLVATVPLWIVLAEVVRGKRPALLQWIGVGVGLVGVGLLVKPSSDASVASVDPYGAAVLMVGSLSWTIGSLFSRTARLATPASMASGMQMICGGVLMMAISVITGELASFDPAKVTTASILAWLYLIVFGSIIGFSTYMWLLTVASPAAVGTYAYVNPVVAVLLGVMVAGETLPPLATIAMVIITGSVALVSLAPYLKRAAKPNV